MNLESVACFLALTGLTILTPRGVSNQVPIYDADHKKTERHLILPPSYITSPERPECDEKAEFPQRIQLATWDNAWQTVESCELHDRDFVTWTTVAFYRAWKKKFGDPEGRVKLALHNAEIVWSSKKRIVERAYDIDGNLLHKVEVAGLYEGSGRMWVHTNTKDYNKISGTAFVHELVHLALDAAHGSADPDHAGPKPDLWKEAHTKFVVSINRKLASHGL